MNQKLNLILAFAAGSAGALLIRYTAPAPAFAQVQPGAVAEVRAKSFILTDDQGRTMAKLTYVLNSAQPPGLTRGRVVLLDQTGREIRSVGGNVMRPLGER